MNMTGTRIRSSLNTFQCRSGGAHLHHGAVKSRLLESWFSMSFTSAFVDIVLPGTGLREETIVLSLKRSNARASFERLESLKKNLSQSVK